MTSSRTDPTPPKDEKENDLELDKDLDIHINLAKFDKCIYENITNVVKNAVRDTIVKSLRTNPINDDVNGKQMHMSIFSVIASSIVNGNKTWAHVDKKVFSQKLHEAIKYYPQNNESVDFSSEIGQYQQIERYHKAVIDKVIPERGSAFSPDLDYQLNLTNTTSCKLGVSLLDCNTVGLLFKCNRLQKK